MPPAVSEPRERLLRTAGGIFYAEGIHGVGVDRIVGAAKVTRATFYRHFLSKDDLVVSYLRGEDAAIRAGVARIAGDGRAPGDVLRGIGAGISGEIRRPGFRGCPFINAAAEYPDPGHPVHHVVVEHRDWFLRTVTDLFAGHTADRAAAPAGRGFVMLRDGAMIAGYLENPGTTAPTFAAGIEDLLT